MPRLGGVELAQRLRRERPEVGILFMSGYPDDSGPADMPPGSVLIEKPFRSNVFLARLRDALGAKTGDGGTR